MKRQIVSYLIITVLLAVPAGVLAQGDTTTESNDVDRTTVLEGLSETDRTDLRAMLDAKLANRQAEITKRLTAQREALLARKCVAAQNRLNGILNSATIPYRSRVAAYDRVVERLEAIVARLELNHVTIDTGELQIAIDTFKSMVDSFLGEYETYLLAVESAADEQACADDPTDFHEFLETARSLRLELKGESAEIRSYLIGEVKTALVNLKNLLAADETAE